MCQDRDDRALLGLEVEALFVLADSGRPVRRSTPDRAAAARPRLAGCRSSNDVRIRYDVGEATAHAIERLAANEPPLYVPDSRPIHLDDYLELLAAEAPVGQWDPGLIWVFPDHLEYPHPARLVASDTREGDRLLARLCERGMPAALVDAGFADVGSLWAPWCVALDGGEIASLAFTVGLSPASAEVGVHTAERYRGRGLAAAVTAGWAALPALGGRVRFYSTTVANRSSQQVTRRLGLRYVGAELTIKCPGSIPWPSHTDGSSPTPAAADLPSRPNRDAIVSRRPPFRPRGASTIRAPSLEEGSLPSGEEADRGRYGARLDRPAQDPARPGQRSAGRTGRAGRAG